RSRRAAAACPVQAILVEEEAGPMSRDLKNGRIVIVGASLAGLRAAETLREEGFAGELTMVGEERQVPYDRPPLSKQVLLGRVRAEDTGCPGAARWTPSGSSACVQSGWTGPTSASCWRTANSSPSTG